LKCLKKDSNGKKKRSMLALEHVLPDLADGIAKGEAAV